MRKFPSGTINSRQQELPSPEIARQDFTGYVQGMREPLCLDVSYGTQKASTVGNRSYGVADRA